MSFSSVKVHYCRYMQDWDKLSERICKSSYVGFDVEYVDKTPATIQLSSPTEAFVLHVFHYKELPKTLIQLLENDGIIKIGVGVKDDLKKIDDKYKTHCQGGLDIGWTAYLIGAISEYRGIDYLGEKLLGEKKLGGFATWGIGRLEKKQIDYAAKDAWIGVCVAEKIIMKV
ncbi:3-5 exonuclease, putative [Entamoeba dispar SAW760]|uniref:3-5 exonuclease, putative n=1 Tax=Entamoeba dispar (strain ATCC PRA-260 / SAW760) TaxID=370354 RepID=B0EJW4_ENTDS|nr:3-5 exonuclease, putative [Entamoeba dispar SAW760]EDR25173.1 3-5 exonuclease, putative [Entamoeba dispar SAW760]|eukprot:EDR25173.1 3-5 exonuclease, putative [Entamoeba dispar SAW760]